MPARIMTPSQLKVCKNRRGPFWSSSQFGSHLSGRNRAIEKVNGVKKSERSFLSKSERQRPIVE